MFGKRWGEAFGADPLGKNDPSNRMQLWIDSLKYIGWPQLKMAMQKIRMFQKPYEGWLPDLQSFTGFANRQQQAPLPKQVTRKPATWIDLHCAAFLLQAIRNEPRSFSKATATEIHTAVWKVRDQYNAMRAEGEVSKEQTPQDTQALSNRLIQVMSKIKITLETPEEREQMIRRALPTSLPTPESSNSPTPGGSSEEDEELPFD